MNTQYGKNTKYIPILILTSALLVLFVYHAPWDLDKRDQARQGLYINDLYYNGNFVIQYHRSQTIETKPPLYNWLAYPFSVLYGETNRWVISLPSILATFGVLLLTFFIGKEIGGEARIGFMAAIILLSNNSLLSLIFTQITKQTLHPYSRPVGSSIPDSNARLISITGCRLNSTASPKTVWIGNKLAK